MDKKILEAIKKLGDKKLHKKLKEIALKNKPIFIFGKSVWIIKHSLVKSKIAIRPYGLIFVSDAIPRDLLDIIAVHEKAEEKYAKKFSKRKAHFLASKEELKYAKKKKKLKKLLNFLKKKFPRVYSERIKILKSS